MTLTRLCLMTAVLLLCQPSILPAQTFEAGLALGSSCTIGEGGCNPLGDSEIRTIGPLFSAWFADWVEVSGQVAWFDRPDLSLQGFHGGPFRYAVTDRQTVIAQAEVAWHFLRHAPVRPFVGAGVGGYRTHAVSTCETPGCEARLGFIGGAPGPDTEWREERSVSGGVSVLLRERLRIRGGLRCHFRAKGYIEDIRSGVFVTLGYRFGKQ